MFHIHSKLDTILKSVLNFCLVVYIYRGSHKSAHILLNLLNELRKSDKKCEGELNKLVANK